MSGDQQTCADCGCAGKKSLTHRHDRMRPALVFGCGSHSAGYRSEQCRIIASLRKQLAEAREDCVSWFRDGEERGMSGGAARERERIVAWLRGDQWEFFIPFTVARQLPAGTIDALIDQLATAIEDGEHDE